MEVKKKPNGERLRRRRSKKGDTERKSYTEPIHDDHWAFLEEIDAPMWVDLNLLESTSGEQDINAGWFEQVHSFHLMEFSTLSHGKVNLETDLLGPSSVSKSRGKYYKSRKWEGNNNHAIRSVSGKTSSGQEVKPRIKIKHSSSFRGKVVGKGSSMDANRPVLLQRIPNLQVTPSLKVRLKSENTSNRDGVKPCSGGSANTLSIPATSSGKSNSTSTSGLDSHKCQSSIVDSRVSCTTTSNGPESISNFGDSQKSSGSRASNGSERFLPDSLALSDLSHQVFGKPCGLLSAVRISLRRSYVMRQPARVEVKDKRSLKGRKSSSSKSSVGSSTSFYDTMLTAKAKKSRTPESKQATKVEQPTDNNKAIVKNLTNRSEAQLLVQSSNPISDGKALIGRFGCQERSKLKISCQSERRRPLGLHNVQSLYSDGPPADNCVTNTKKGKVIGHPISSQKTECKGNNVGSTVWYKNGLKHVSIGKENELFPDTKLFHARIYLTNKACLRLDFFCQRGSSGDVKA
ncbi:hypothetical protein IFM89_035050 [Coptis chinensis]|uniref:Uncharacterized protein n=1 Tax=Coptis chinensis TaxID=261450 RepID=A0A835HAF4_9MAGN|nr:hypothetical protein IFM89_035050 [Coptis chinensis]